MKARTNLARCCLVACALGTIGLQAQDSPFSTAFKFRALLSSSSSDQGLTNDVIGSHIELGGAFGLEVGYALGQGKVTGELGYTFMTGDQQLADTSGMATSSSTVTIGSGSLESRKNKIEGMHLRLGYEAPCTDTLSWRAGLQFGGNTFTNQVLGNISGTGPKGAYADSYYFVGSKSNLAPSPYCGMTVKFDEASALEFGVLFMQYTAISYQHVANTNNQFDSLASKNKVLPNLEVAYVFRF